MKVTKVFYLKKTESHFNEAMRLNGERDGIEHAGVYMADDTNAIMYCAGVKIILKRVFPHLWIIIAVRFIGHMPVSWPVYVLRRVKHGAYEHFCRVVDHWRTCEQPIGEPC